MAPSTTTTTKIPVVDLGELSVDSEKEPCHREWERVGVEISRAFGDIGFVYLTNHGIQQRKVEEINQLSGKFFQLDETTKLKYKRGVQAIQGYSAPNQERLTNAPGTHELRESYDVQDVNGVLPDAEVAALRPILIDFAAHLQLLTSRLLTAMAIGLGLERSYFTSKHEKMGSSENATCIRMLYYPPLPANVSPGTTRIAPHTDYGTITLLFQDDVGGLEVRDRADAWVSAEPLPGTVLVNVGDILQFWTTDKFRATEHRVLIPSTEVQRTVARRSLVFFVHPDDDVLIRPLDESSCYSPVTAKAHTEKRFAETYQY